jgi:hypothetical protein
MQDVRFDRLKLALPASMFHCMENRKELYAYEIEARRLRSEEMARLLKAAVVAFRSFFSVRAKEMKHA